jgi:galactonate dehydratase
MYRRTFLQSLIPSTLILANRAEAALRSMKITRIRQYQSPISPPQVNQSFHVVTVETDQGITGIGEGGSPDLMKQCASMLIGEDPSRIDHLWQLLYRGLFYPAGRERVDTIGALDLALWDIKGKVLGVPVYELLGGLARDHVECYCTSYPSNGLSLREAARSCVEFGFRAYRTSVADPAKGQPFNSHEAVRNTVAQCNEIREGVGKNGDWAIDYHTRLDLPDAIRLSTLIEGLEPYFCEDLVRSEDPAVYRTLRPQVKVPIAVGEQFGARWDTSALIEQNLIHYARVTMPNVGGITEYKKIADLCETHYVGLIPHFTGPISEAALVHICGIFSGPVLMEMTWGGKNPVSYLPECFDFNKGKLYPNQRPGLGVTFDPKGLNMFADVTERSQPVPIYHRPDGSYTNW